MVYRNPLPEKVSSRDSAKLHREAVGVAETHELLTGSGQQRDASGFHSRATNTSECEIRTYTFQRRGKPRRMKIAGSFPGDDEDLTHA